VEQEAQPVQGQGSEEHRLGGQAQQQPRVEHLDVDRAGGGEGLQDGRDAEQHHRADGAQDGEDHGVDREGHTPSSARAGTGASRRALRRLCSRNRLSPQ
jgi:hypothetical protein